MAQPTSLLRRTLPPWPQDTTLPWFPSTHGSNFIAASAACSPPRLLKVGPPTFPVSLRPLTGWHHPVSKTQHQAHLNGHPISTWSQPPPLIQQPTSLGGLPGVANVNSNIPLTFSFLAYFHLSADQSSQLPDQNVLGLLSHQSPVPTGSTQLAFPNTQRRAPLTVAMATSWSKHHCHSIYLFSNLL